MNNILQTLLNKVEEKKKAKEAAIAKAAKEAQKKAELEEEIARQELLNETKRCAADVISSIDEQVSAFNKLIKQYTSSIKEAIKNGDDGFAEELADSIIDLEEFIKDLKAIREKVYLDVHTAQAFAGMSNLTKVVSTLTQLQDLVPDFSALSTQMSNLSTTFNAARNQLKSFRTSISKKTGDVYTNLFNTENPKDTQKRDARKKQLLDAAVASVSIEDTDPKPAEPKATKGSDNTIDSILSMLDDEKNK